MRYPTFKGFTQKRFGLTLTDKTKGEYNVLSSHNLTEQNGSTVSRKGLNTLFGGAVFSGDGYTSVIKPLTACGVKRCIDAENAELSYAIDGDLYSYADIHFFWISESKVTKTAGIHYSRVSDDSFYEPVHVTAFNASPLKGCGVYAFVTAEDANQKDFRVYELSADMSEWIRHYENDLYVPTIYINGRGMQYEATNSLLDVYKPIELEQPNMLCGWFKAYYHSDGYSSVFQLPLSGLDDKTVTCRYYTAPNVYTEWMVYDGASSAETTLGTVRVTMSCDRVTGTVRFTSGNGVAYALPVAKGMNGNNVEFIASRTVADAENIILGSKGVYEFNSRLYFYLNGLKGECVAVSKQSNPLYFPLGSIFDIGNSNVPIDAVKPCGDGLFIFKKDGIYELKGSFGDSYSSDDVAGGLQGIYYKPDKYKCTLKYFGHGCRYPQSLCRCGNSLIWVDFDSRVYKLASDTSRLTDITGEIQKLIDPDCIDENNIHAMCIDGRYVLMTGDKAVCSNKENNELLYVWNLPQNLRVTSVAVPDASPIPLSFSEQSQQSFALIWNGEADIVPDKRGVLQSYPIEVSLAVNPLDFGKPWHKKTVYAMLVTASAQKLMQITFNGRDMHLCDCVTADGKELKTVRIRPRRYSKEQIGFTIGAKAPICIKDITFLYRELSEVK